MPNSLPGRIAALVLATLALPGCGGGTDPATEPNLRTITIDVGNDGESDGINIELSAPLLMVGDDNLATVKRALLIFPLDNIPAGATVSSAALNLSFGAKSGSPATNLGPLRFVRFQAADGISPAGYLSSELAHDPAADVTTDPENTRLAIDATRLVQSAVTGGDFALAVRIQYTVPTAGAGEDSVSIASANNAVTDDRPSLDVVLAE